MAARSGKRKQPSSTLTAGDASSSSVTPLVDKRPKTVISTTAIAAPSSTGDFVRGKPARSKDATASSSVSSAETKRDTHTSDVLFGTKAVSQRAARASSTGGEKGSNKGGTPKKRMHKREALKEAAHERLTKKAAAAARRKGSNGTGVAGSETASSAGAQMPSSVTSLSYGNLKIGMPLLGAIKSLNDRDLDITISLPNGLHGYVSLREVSDTMAHLVDRFVAEDDDDEPKQRGKSSSKKGKAAAAVSTDRVVLPKLDLLFTVGQMVRVVIVALEKKEGHKRIELSMRAALVNRSIRPEHLKKGNPIYGSIKSIEDKGYIIDLGIPVRAPDDDDSHTLSGQSLLAAAVTDLDGKLASSANVATVTGFLPKNETDTDFKGVVGQPIECTVRADTTSDTRVIGVSSKRDGVVRALVKETNSEITWRGVKPGMRVRAEVAKVTNDGIIMKILGMFYGTVHLFHLAKPVTKEWANDYEIGSSFQARVLFIDYTSRKLGLTLLPHIVSLTPLVLPSSISSGLIIEDALVLRVESKTGVLLTVPLADAVAGPKPKPESKKGKGSQKGSIKKGDDEAKQALVAAAAIPADAPPLVLYAHISKVSEKRVTNLGGTYNVGSHVRARCIGVSPLDGVVSVTLNPTVIDQEIMWYDDLKAGEIVTGEVLAIESFGLKVKLAPNVRAICPTLHLADTNVSDPSKKFTVGKQLKFKVWDVDASSQKATVTHKKTLLTSSLPLITSFASATRGLVTYGVITSVKDFGCIVEFYNGIHGLVSVKDLRKMSGLGETQSPMEAYHRGAVMRVRVKKCSPDDKKLFLSFSTTRGGAGDDNDDGKKDKYTKSLARRVEEVNRCLPPGAFVSGTVRGLWPKKVDDKPATSQASEEKKDKDDESDDDMKKPERAPMVSISEELKVEVIVDELVDNDDSSEGKNGKSKKGVHDAPKVTMRRMFECILAAEHLTDHPTNAAPLVALTQKEGTVLETLCVLYIDREGRAHLTAKPSLLTALDTRKAKVSTPAAAAVTSSSSSSNDMDEEDDSDMTPAKMADRKRRASLKILGTPTTSVVVKKDGTSNKGGKKGSTKNGKEEKQVVPIEPPSNATDEPDASQVPEHFDDVRVNMLLVGYVRQVVGYGVFVGFRGSLVALAPRAHLCDHFVTQPAHHFATGQSVRARVIEVDAAKKQFLVTLKPSQTSFSLDSDGAFVRSFFDERARIDAANGAPATATVDWSLFAFGSRISGNVATVKDVGVLLTFPTLGVTPAKKKKAAAATPSAPTATGGAVGVMGLAVVSQTGDGKKKVTATSNDNNGDDDEPKASSSQLKELYKVGSAVDCRVLDVSRQRGIVDVSLRRDVVGTPATAANKRSIPPLGSVVQVEVQLVQKEYLVCSIPKFDNAVGFASTTSYNLRVSPHALFKAGQRFDAYVYAVPDNKTDRILLVLNIGSAIAARKKKGANFWDASIRNTSAIQPGTVVKVKVTDVKSPHVFVSFGAEISNLAGRIHVSELADVKEEKKSRKDGKDSGSTTPVSVDSWKDKIGQLVTAKVLSVTNKKDKKVQRVELTARPSDLASADPPVARVTFDNIRVGQQLRGVVNHVIARRGTPPAVHMDISYALRATMTGDDITSDVAVLDHLYSYFPAGAIVNVTVKSVDTADRHVAVSLHGSLPSLSPEVAATLAAAAEKRAAHQAHVAANAANLPQPGQVFNGTITKLEAGVGATVQLAAPHDKLHGRVHIMDIADDWLVDPLASLEEKQTVKVVVMATRQDADGNNLQIDLSLRASAIASKRVSAGRDGIPRDVANDEVKVGDIVRGYVVATSRAGCFISLNRSLIVRCQLKNLSNQFVATPEVSFPAGKLVTARVKAIDDGKIEVTLKKSAVNAPKDPVKLDELKVGMLVKGVVKAVDSKLGVFVILKNSKLQALCHVSQISDAFVKDPAEHYETGDRVKAVITVIDTEKKRISIALKASVLATATSVLEYKRADGSGMRADVDHASDSENDDDEREQAAVRQANKDKRRQEREAAERKHKRDSKAGQKRKADTKDDDNDGHDGEGDEKDESPTSPSASSAAASSDDTKTAKADKSSSKRVKTGAAAILAALEADEDSDDDINNGDDITELVSSGKKQIAKTVQAAVDKVFDEAPALQVDMKASSSSDAARDSDDDDDTPAPTDDVDESNDGDDTNRPGRHAKAAARRREEKRISEREELMASADGARPTTAADYDRLVLTSPNSSVIWVNYIAHHVAIGEIDRARRVAERALKSISFREEKEKWNVWVALLSLENLYGSRESLDDAFKRCLQYNDAKRSYMELAKVYAGANRHSEAVTAYNDACNKFHSDADVWISYGIYLSKQNNYDGVRSLMKRALEKLPKREHARIISKFATLEFRHGSAERGRTMFDGLVASYPKRVDLWSVYLDQELRPEATSVASNHVIIRRLFERVTSLNLSSKKSRFFFKRWLAFEKQFGNDATRDHVLARARAFVEGNGGNDNTSDNVDDGDDA